jgi:hypothetical protein
MSLISSRTLLAPRRTWPSDSCAPSGSCARDGSQHGHVAHLGADRVEVEWATDPFGLGYDPVRRFEPGRHMLDRVGVVDLVELLAQDRQLRGHRLDSEPVGHVEPGPLPAGGGVSPRIRSARSRSRSVSVAVVI